MFKGYSNTIDSRFNEYQVDNRISITITSNRNKSLSVRLTREDAIAFANEVLEVASPPAENDYRTYEGIYEGHYE